MIEFEDFFTAASQNALAPWSPALRAALKQGFYARPHGELQDWWQALQQLPQLEPSQLDFDSAAVRIGSADQLDPTQNQQLLAFMQRLHPWRKGPWLLFGIEIDAEWRSDMKWARVARHIQPLEQRLVLDVGCGNGYYGWRMLAQQPRMVLGIDPSQKFLLQFALFKRYAPQAPIHYLPLRDEDLPARMEVFDTVFSMGVLYHRRSPFDHLEQLKNCLKPGGELVLETLVVDGGLNQVLVPRDRYAQMPNVWFIPSVETLGLWLERMGFTAIRCVDLARTTTAEQRRTDWMRFQSLEDYLDPENPGFTLEGYQAPTRAVLLARKA